MHLVFGLTKEETVGRVKTSDLMPSIYAKQHTFFVSGCKFVKSKAINQHKRVICLHKLGHVFLANKYLKLFVKSNFTYEYVAMFRLLHNKSWDFFLINSYWEIDSLTLRLANLIGIDPIQYKLVYGNFKGNQRNVLNSSEDFQFSDDQHGILSILILAPRLLQYSPFADYLEESDKDLFVY